MTDQLEKIRPLDWIASGQHENWNLQCCDLVDQMLTLVRVEFHGIPVRLGGSAAVDTSEVARLGHFPDGDEWPFAKVDRVDLRVHALMRPRLNRRAQ